MNNQPHKHVSGFVSILGLPNAGKSTLLNALVGSKVAIVSNKPQTTRTSLQAVMTLENAQVVFMDTPGIHEAPRLLHRRMMESVREALAERDLLVWVTDASHEFNRQDGEALKMLEANPAPVFLVLNKIDQIKEKHQLLPLIEAYKQIREFKEIFPVSALEQDGLDGLRDAIVAAMPEGPQYFPNDFVTDQPERFLAAELIREQVLETTRQEVPHAVAVMVDVWDETPKLVRIAATIFVEREGQKKILIGAKGSVLKKIGTDSRLEMEGLLGKKIFLELFIKVRPNWRDNPQFLNEIDWRYMAGGES
ncbi:MAG: GTPase Era [Bryobacterales bacterium]|nr:GTPase Era [Bryobacterales bacterium]